MVSARPLHWSPSRRCRVCTRIWIGLAPTHMALFASAVSPLSVSAFCPRGGKRADIEISNVRPSEIFAVNRGVGGVNRTRICNLIRVCTRIWIGLAPTHMALFASAVSPLSVSAFCPRGGKRADIEISNVRPSEIFAVNRGSGV